MDPVARLSVKNTTRDSTKSKNIFGPNDGYSMNNENSSKIEEVEKKLDGWDKRPPMHRLERKFRNDDTKDS
jgi:hypothetical protein